MTGVVLLRNKLMQSPISASNQLNNKRVLEKQNLEKKRENVLSSSLNNIGKISNAVMAVGKEATARKNINFNKISYDHSPGMLMNLAKSEHFSTFDSACDDNFDNEYCEK